MALSTSRTLITKTGISTTQIFDMGGINIPGGDFNLGSAIKLGNASGIITATSFSGAFSGDLSIDDKIVHTGDTDTAIRFPAADRISAEVAGSEKVRISSIGVGINTDSSLYHSGNSHLIVRGNNITSSSDDAIAAFHSGTAGKGQIRFTDGASGYHASQSWVEYDHSNAKFAIGWNAQTRAYGGPNNEFGLYYDTPSNLDSNAHELVIGGGTGSGGMTLFNSTSGQGNIFFADGIGSAAAKKVGRIVYDHSDNSMQFTTNSSETLRIKTDGNIGIGTTLPNVSGFNADAKVLTLSGSKRGIIELRGDVPAADTIGAIRFFSANNNKAEIKSVTDGSFNSNFVFTSNGSERVTLDEHLTISDGNLVIGTSGHGIDFSDTGNGNGTMQNELLDDYEEGLWTPTGPSGVSDYLFNNNAGYYTKIGNIVWWFVHTTTSLVPNNNNVYEIHGLPYTSAATNHNYGWANNIVYTTSSNSTIVANMRPLVQRAASYVYFHTVGQGTSARVTNSQFRTAMQGQTLIMAGNYQAT